MKTSSYLLYALCALLQSCNFANAQIVWLTSKNQDFTNCDREVREVKPFTGISDMVPFDVIYEQGSELKVVVEGDSEYFDRLHTDVVNGNLEIKMDRGRYRNVRLRVRVSSPEIESLKVAGSGDLTVRTDIRSAGDFLLRVAGSGNITTQDIRCGALSVSVSGSGDVKIGDIAGDDMEVKIAGSGDFKAIGATVNELSVSIAGSGDISIAQVDVEDLLSASVAGSGDVAINGQAGTVKARVVGSGDIRGRIKYGEISKTKSGSGEIEW